MSLDMSDTGGQCDAASRLFQTRVGRGRYVLARVCVCRVRIQSCRWVVYRWPGVVRARFAIESVFASALRMEGPVDLLCREFRSRAKARWCSAAKMWKFDPEQLSDEAKNASRSRTVGTSSDYCDLGGTDQLFLANECKQSDEFYENVIEHICAIIMFFGANLRITHSRLWVVIHSLR